MEFTEGQVVVHPHHGPATVTGVTSRPFRGEPTSYLLLAVQRNNLTISVPVAGINDAGLRPVFGPTQLEELFDVLRAPTGEVEESWSRRFKANSTRINHGNLLTTATVVRDLTRRLEDRGLSRGEKDQLRYARGPLVVEVALSCDLTPEEAEARVEAAILADGR
ncbi:MAG: CarD family transcriptional regulator [Actinomycetota bacterium]